MLVELVEACDGGCWAGDEELGASDCSLLDGVWEELSGAFACDEELGGPDCSLLDGVWEELSGAFACGEELGGLELVVPVGSVPVVRGGAYRVVVRSCVCVGRPRCEVGARRAVVLMLSRGCCVLVVVVGAPVAEVAGGGATIVLLGSPALGLAGPAGGPPAFAIPEVAVAIAANSVATPRPEAASCPCGRHNRGIGLLGWLGPERQLRYAR